MKTNKFKNTITPIVGIIFISIMIWSYIENPPLYLNEIGWEYSNYKGSLSKHISLVIFTLLIEKILYFKLKLSHYFLFLVSIYIINLIWAFTNTMHQGSIAATYLIWCVFILIYVIINSILERL